MTLAEKIGQLNLLPAGEGLTTGAGGGGALGARLAAGALGGVFGAKSRRSARALQDAALAGSRLKIPLMLAEDVIHGHRTIFPLPLALACSWDMDLIAETAAFAAVEARAEGVRQVYSPMLDVTRDPRWGRVAESPGEDPTLAADIAEAMVRGYQGADPAGAGRVAACPKHFVAYGAPESGRDYDNASLALEDLFDVYAAPFAAGVRAGAASVMVSFNAVNKIPMHAHEELIEGWLRGACGFDGLVVSDYTGVRELSAHGLGGRAAVVTRALRAGVDMDMVGEDYLAALPALAEDGIDCAETGTSASAAEIRALIDRACRRVLIFKARLGLFDDPYAGMAGEEPPRAPTAEGRALARRAATASAVLLKNEELLPLTGAEKIALVGPFADDRLNMLGTWAVSGDPAAASTLREGFAERTGAHLLSAKGANIVDEPWLADRLNVHGPTVAIDPHSAEDMIAGAVACAREADVVVVALGEAKEHAGESSSRLSPELPASQRRLLAALADVGKPFVVVVFAGRPLALGPEAERANALVLAWHGGTEGGRGVADLLFGDAEPTGRLAAALPAHPGQTPLSHAAEPTGRPYPGRFAKFLTGWLDMPEGPSDVGGLYPFGYGLGYAPVRYGPPTADKTVATGEEDWVEISVEVTNAGTRPTVETVQLYLSDPVARIVRPARALKAYRRVSLGPGETRRVGLTVGVEMLRYTIAPSLDRAARVWDPGRFVLHVGPNSRDTQSVEILWER